MSLANAIGTGSPIVREFLDGYSGQLPLVIKPAGPGVSLLQWVSAHKEELEADLAHYGGVLFRGFGIDTTGSFDQFMKCFDTTPLPYMFRSSPRQELDRSVKNIYRSTSYPHERSINMHNESSYSRVWARKIVFCCIQPATTGGETPIADSRQVLKSLPAALVGKFRDKGIKYRRNISPAFGMPWQEVFQTNEVKEVINTCTQYGIRYQFQDNDRLILEWTKPAIYRHPVTGEETWFNHAFFFHKYSRLAELGLDHDDLVPEDFLSSETFFGDGSAISFAEYTTLQQAYETNKVIFPYQKGDIIFLDNFLSAHGRNPYQGDRLIATAMVEPFYDAV